MTSFSPLPDLILRTIAAAASHRTFFNSVTAITAACIAAGAFWIHQTALRKEDWLRYFGAGYAVFALQYAIPSAYGAYRLFFPQPHTEPAYLWITSITSSFNNVFFLAAALSLLRFKKLFPWWGWTLAALAATSDIAKWTVWYRVPDALLSVLSLGLLGIALFTCISPHFQKKLALFALLGGSLYALLNVLYALTPPWTEGDLWHALTIDLDSYLAPRSLAPREALDTYLVAWALPLKVFLAIGGFLLVLRNLTLFSPKALEGDLKKLDFGDFFIGDVFISMLGEHFKADKAALWFRLPGLREDRAAVWEWYCDEPQDKRRFVLLPHSTRGQWGGWLGRLFRRSSNRQKPRSGFVARKADVVPIPSPQASPEGRALVHGVPYEAYRKSPNDPFGNYLPAKSHVYGSKIVVPMFYRGALIGCLSAAWDTQYAFTFTAVQQLQSLADFFAPAVDQRRRLSAIYYLTEQLEHFHHRLPGGDRGAATELASLVHLTLSPLAVSLSFRVGFRPVWSVAGDNGNASGDLKEHPEVAEKLYLLSRYSDREISVKRSLLKINEVNVGTLSLAWPSRELPGLKTRPSVIPDFLLLRSIASFVAVSYLDATHIGLNSILSDLQIALNEKAVRTRETWHSLLQNAIVESGLLWLVVEHPSESLQGHEDHVAGVRSLEEKSEVLISLKAPMSGAWTLLRLPLVTTGSVLWLGIANHRFGPEIGPYAQDDWPWSTFLERLKETADASLSRIMSQQEVDRLRGEATQLQSLFASSADATTFFHECRNIARNFTFAAQSLQELWEIGLLEAKPAVSESVENDLSGLLKSAKRLYGLTDALLQVRRDGHQPSCNILRVVQSVEEIIQYVLHDNNIVFNVDRVESKSSVNVPFYVTHQAILSLVSNSIDAIQEHGGTQIRIETEEEGSAVICRVIDDGPGIATELGDRLFSLGASTKTGTGGKGLFIIRNLVQRHGGDVVLERSSRGYTAFAIRLPRRNGKEIQYESEEPEKRIAC